MDTTTIGRFVCKPHNHTNEVKVESECKICGKPGISHCTDCYHEYHESKEELMGGVEDGKED